MNCRQSTIVAVVVLAGCGSAPTVPTPQPCVVHNTAVVTFENRSATSTYDVLWDGSPQVRLTPGQKSQVVTVAAGVAHTLLWQFSDGRPASTTSTPILAQCSNTNFYCDY